MTPSAIVVENLRGVGAAIARLLTIAGCAVMLAGCWTSDQMATPSAFDYRLRHPIAISEGPRGDGRHHHRSAGGNPERSGGCQRRA
jgi:hypothetical protein